MQLREKRTKPFMQVPCFKESPSSTGHPPPAAVSAYLEHKKNAEPGFPGSAFVVLKGVYQRMMFTISDSSWSPTVMIFELAW
jgi:hypothetical protein